MQDDKELNSLKALAEKATPGPWKHSGRYIGTNNHLSYVGECRDENGNWSDTAKSRADSAYIAAANPAAIRSLLSRIEQQAARIEELTEEVAIDDKLLADRNRVMQAIPGCGAHGHDCVPHALEWIAKASSPSPAVDLSGLTRYALGAVECAYPCGSNHFCNRIEERVVGEYVKLTDVQALLATPAHDVGGLTEERLYGGARKPWGEVLATKEAEPVPQRESVREAVQEALARTNAYVCGRTWSAWQVGTMSEDDFQDACTDGDLLDEVTDAAIRALATSPAPTASQGEVKATLTADDVEWVVNDNAELGVKIGNQFFFLYKGGSLVYESGKHDDGTPMMWRLVGKREFGECCHPVKFYKDGAALPRRYTDELVYTPGLSFGKPGDCDWMPLPAAPSVTDGEAS